MTAAVQVRCGKSPIKDSKDLKDRIKERKELSKEIRKEIKEQVKERKDLKDRVEVKGVAKEARETGAGYGFGEGSTPAELLPNIADLESRAATLEAMLGVGGEAQPFIGTELRPDLIGGPDYSNQGDLQQRMAAGDRDAKRAYDTLPQS
jgi:immune inhibitor A